MPAVQLNRLKEQIQLIASVFDQPEFFIKALHGLLEQYEDHTYKPAQTVNNAVLSIDSYHVPPVVMNQLEFAVNQWTRANPTAGFELAQALWKDPKLEPRILGCTALGAVSVDHRERVINQIIEWAVPTADKILLQQMFERATITLRRQAAQFWLEQIRAWLVDSRIEIQRMALLALLPLVQDRTFQNLPAVYNSLGTVMQTNAKPLQNELRNILVVLAGRSPTETIYFIKQMFGMGPSEDFMRLIRRCLPDFPAQVRERLREILHSLPRTS